MNPYSYGYGSPFVPGFTFNNNHHDHMFYLQQQVNASLFPPPLVPKPAPAKKADPLCPCCKKSTKVDPGFQEHDEQFPEKCYEHKRCMEKGGWKKHLRSSYHTECPLVGCPKSGADFGTDQRFLQHWRKKHPEKLWAWETYTTWWGARRVQWRKWNGR